MLLTFISLEFLEHELTNIVFPYLTTVNSNNSIFTKEKLIWHIGSHTWGPRELAQYNRMAMSTGLHLKKATQKVFALP